MDNNYCTIVTLYRVITKDKFIFQITRVGRTITTIVIFYMAITKGRFIF